LNLKKERQEMQTMRNLLGVFLGGAIVVFGSGALADWPVGVAAIRSEPNKTVLVTGRLESGRPMADLSWASSSSMACFPATQNAKFRGNHVLFSTKLPAHAEMYITVTPTDPTKDLSIYAYSIGTNNFRVPPTVPSAVSCEAEYKWDRPKAGRTQGASRTVRLNATTNPYNVLIGVSGPAGATTGEFALSIELKGGAAASTAARGGAAAGPATGWPANVTPVSAAKGQTVAVTGRLESGAPMADLSWASNSSMACFPATQNDKFRGNHVFFSASLPPRSEMYITVTPKDPTKDVSIYAYMVGTNNYSLAPNIASAVTCEAEYKWDRPKRGRTQDSTRTVRLNATTNPYNVLIGVSGPAGSTAGEFTLSIETK
jgi:hypothetical protein